MEWLKWGRQGSVFGWPLAIALLMEAFMNLYNIFEIQSLLRSDLCRINFLSMGSIITNSITDGPRFFLLIRATVLSVWAFLVLLNVVVLGTASWLAMVTLILCGVVYVVVAAGDIYSLALYILGSYAEFDPELILFHISSPFPWPSHFWVTFIFTLMVQTLLAVIILDVHYSYLKVLQAGGNGWESKAYFQIRPQTDQDEATPLAYA